MEKASKGLFVVMGVFGLEEIDPKLKEMNDINAKWQCPVIMEPCYMIQYTSIECLIKHMREEHCLDIVHHSTSN
jgi:hypothetical protein